jgi:hypothetical protein
MGQRSIVVKKSVAQSIANAAWFIESKGLLVTAEKFSEGVYDFIEKLAGTRISYRLCSEPQRKLLGFKCVQYKKYTIVFFDDKDEITIFEFIPSKLINW